MCVHVYVYVCVYVCAHKGQGVFSRMWPHELQNRAMHKPLPLATTDTLKPFNIHNAVKLNNCCLIKITSCNRTNFLCVPLNLEAGIVSEVRVRVSEVRVRVSEVRVRVSEVRVKVSEVRVRVSEVV